MESIIKELIKKDENLWLEYKSFWYWNEEDSDLIKGWGEFLKDFAALFNTHTEESDTKYFILGFDESTKKCQNYNIDQNSKKLRIFNNIDEFKDKIIAKLKTFFLNIPVYRSSNDLESIETLFELKQVNIGNNQLLVININPAPYLLELKTVLQGNEQFKEGSIIIRSKKVDGSPENINARHDKVTELKSTVNKIQERGFPQKDASIEKVVGQFKSKVFPSSTIENICREHNYSTGIHFEIYRLQGEYNPAITFLYITSYTSQDKTFQYLKEKRLLEDGNKIIVLTDEKNRKKGRIDKSRIEKVFNRRYSDIEVYYLEEFALKKLYSDLFDPSIFHQGNFNIKNFTHPYTDVSTEKTADVILKEWYRKEQDPLIVIKGPGGIGKTTVLKFFLDDIYKRNRNKNTNILFINSHEIINDIMKTTDVKDIFDFYEIIANKYNITKKFDKKMLELSIDTGNLIIALDGIDEVIAKVGSKFDIHSFINAIFENYSENLERTKVIITCRDYFWDNNLFDFKISTINLKPFDKSLAKKYFLFHFERNQGKLKKAMALANEFALEKETYVPYILDMIAENILDNMVSSNIDSNILLPENDANDYLVSKVCEREIVKLDNLVIDDQISVFIYMATRFNGVLHSDQFDKLESHLREKYNKNIVQSFKAHPLLCFENKILKFRYDFFNDYFKNISLAIFLKKTDFSEISTDTIEIITQYVSYSSSFMTSIKKRLFNTRSEKIKESIWEFLSIQLNELEIIDKRKKQQLCASLFILLLTLNPRKDIETRTSILKEIFESNNNNNIFKLCIINLHTTGNDKPIFDFRGLKFDECVFENYEYFSECKFDSDTYFTNTKFIAPLVRDGVRPNVIFNNIDRSSCDISGIVDVLKLEDQVLQDKDSKLRHDLRRIIKFFWSNSSFRQKLASDANKKLRLCSSTLDNLIKNKVVFKHT